MRTVFLILVALVTVVGMFVQNAEEEATIVRAYVENAFQYVQGHVEEHPQQVGASVLTMIVSTVIWIGITRILKASDNKLVQDIRSVIVQAPEQDAPIVAKAKARQVYNQLRLDRTVLEGRQVWIPEEVERTKKELAEAENKRRILKAQYELAKEVTDKLQNKLDELMDEHDRQSDELLAIEMELNRLKDLI